MPWLPLAESGKALAVSAREAEEGSTRHRTRQRPACRKPHRLWALEVADVPEAVGEVVLSLRHRGRDRPQPVPSRPDIAEIVLPLMPRGMDGVSRALRIEGRSTRIGACGFAPWVAGPAEALPFI